MATDANKSWLTSVSMRKLLGLGGDAELSSGTKALYACLCALFVCGSGLASGLTLGLMSLDPLDMQVLLRSGTPRQQKLAKKILPIIADPHWLLVTLLLCNAACFEALPLFLDALINPLGAILISVTLILMFGEILPQAVCCRYGLEIGAALKWLVWVMMWLTCPISWPLARMLDWLLGKEGYDTFMRHELKALVDLHGEDEGLGGKLSEDEVQIICGALDLTNKIAYSVMTPLDKVVMLSTNQKIDRETVNRILASGHSRLPVYLAENRSSIIGLVLVKELLAHAFPTDDNQDQGPVQVSQLKIRPLPRLPANTRCYDMLKLFRTGRAHMMLLTQPGPEDLPPPAHAPVEAPHHDSALSKLSVTLSHAFSTGRNSKQVDNHGSPPASPTLGGATKRRDSHKDVSNSTASSSERPSQGQVHGEMQPVHTTVATVPDLALAGEPIGIITIEDVLEELMGQEILDETDHFADNEQTLPANDELRAKMAQKLPERLREVVLGSAMVGVVRRYSKGQEGGSKGKQRTTSGKPQGTITVSLDTVALHTSPSRPVTQAAPAAGPEHV